MKKSETVKEETTKTKYAFPEYDLVIEAESVEEANKILLSKIS